jgi:hypothetical protein
MRSFRKRYFPPLPTSLEMPKTLGILAMVALLFWGCSNPAKSPEEVALSQKWKNEEVKVRDALSNRAIARLLNRENLQLRLVITDVAALKLRSIEIRANIVSTLERRILERPNEEPSLRQTLEDTQRDHDEFMRALDLFASEKRPSDQLLYVSPAKGKTFYILVRDGEIIRRGGAQNWIE